MTTTDLSPPGSPRRADRPSVLGQVWAGLAATTDWLDERGRKAWIALTVACFFVAPPLGVALLLFILGTGRMFRHNGSRSVACGWGRRDEVRMMREGRMSGWKGARTAMRPSGNAAFDSYKADTLRRLEEEQAQFEEFLARLREARDKAEFDQFMAERRKRSEAPSQDADV